MRRARVPGAVGVHTVTSARSSAADEQAARVKRYLFTMGIRTACFVLVLVVPGWWRLVAVVAAAILPYIAVVMANAVAPKRRGSASAVVPSGYASGKGLGSGSG